MNSIQAEAIRQGNFTVVTGLYTTDEGEHVSFIGCAKRHPKDVDDEKRGERLAMARAFVDLGEQLEEIENDLIANPKPVE